jgi:effector-binding domain-containing protein
MLDTQIETKTVEARPTLTIRTITTLAGIGPSCADILPAVKAHIDRHGLKTVGPPFVAYHSFSPERVDMSGGMMLEAAASGEGRIETGTLPGGQAITLWHVGPYEDLARTHNALHDYLDQHKLESSMCWEVYWTDPIPGSDASQWTTEVVYLLK